MFVGFLISCRVTLIKFSLERTRKRGGRKIERERAPEKYMQISGIGTLSP